MSVAVQLYNARKRERPENLPKTQSLFVLLKILQKRCTFFCRSFMLEAIYKIEKEEIEYKKYYFHLSYLVI